MQPCLREGLADEKLVWRFSSQDPRLSAASLQQSYYTWRLLCSSFLGSIVSSSLTRKQVITKKELHRSLQVCSKLPGAKGGHLYSGHDHGRLLFWVVFEALSLMCMLICVFSSGCGAVMLKTRTQNFRSTAGGLKQEQGLGVLHAGIRVGRKTCIKHQGSVLLTSLDWLGRAVGTTQPRRGHFPQRAGMFARHP